MSNNSQQMEKLPTVEIYSGEVAESSRCPFDDGADHHRDEPTRNPAVNVARSSLWRPLYLTSLVAMVAVLILLGVSTAIVMFYVEVRPGSYIETTAFAAVCDGGCGAADEIIANNLFKTDAYETREVVRTEILPQMRPFAVTSCEERSAGVYDVAAGSHTAKARGTFHVNCATPYVSWQYTDFKYAEGFTFFNAVGAPRIHRTDYLVENQAVPVVAILFVFSGLSLIFHVAVVALRATLSDASIAHTRTQCCGCNGPNHVRRLTAAVISFLVLSVVMTVVQLALCGYGKVPSDCGEGCVEYIVVAGGYWAIFAIILVLQVVALGLVCACYTMRV